MFTITLLLIFFCKIHIHMYVQDVQCKKNGEDDLLLVFSLFHSQLCTVGASSSLSALSRGGLSRGHPLSAQEKA